MKQEALISVIVPIYRVEEYLPRCIDSLLAQTYQNIQIILVDDGSPDACGRICDEYASTDKRIQVIHKENGGLSDARNAGLSAAKGDYIAFVDSDDWVASEYLERMQQSLCKHDADICECSVQRTNGDVLPVKSEKKTERVFGTEAALAELIQDGDCRQHVWNKLYRRSCLIDITFPVGKTNEDEFWTYRVFGNAQTIVRIDDVLYFYFQRPGSIMGSQYSLKRLDALEAKQERQRYLEKNYPALADAAKVNLFACCIYAGQMAMMFLKGTERQQARERIDSIQRISRPHAQHLVSQSLMQKVWIRMARFHFWMTVYLKNMLRKGL